MAGSDGHGAYCVHYPVRQGPGGVQFGKRKGRVVYGAYTHNELARFAPKGILPGEPYPSPFPGRQGPRRRRRAPRERFPWDEYPMGPHLPGGYFSGMSRY